MRSKTLLATNIVVTIYSVVSMWILIGAIILDAGGESIIKSVGSFFESIFETIGTDLAIINYLYLLAISLFVHIGLFFSGCIVSWIAYATKKDGIAMAAFIIYVVGAVSSPICLIIGIPVSALAFIGATNQRKLNKTAKK